MKKILFVFLTFFLVSSFFSFIELKPKIDVTYAQENYEWIPINNGLYGGYVNSLAIDPTNTQILYAGTWGGIFKSTDGGLNWKEINKGLTDKRVLSIIIDPTNTQILYAGTGVGGIFKSTNGGSNWSNIGLTNKSVLSLAIDPQNTNTIYAGTYDSGVFKCIRKFSIIASSSSGGTVSPSGSIIANYGESKTFTITPNSGYKIKDVKVDGVSVGGISTYTFENITQDHTIEAIFEQITYTINSSSTPGGTISPSGTIILNYGESKTFTITPDSGYKIKDVKVDGVSVGIVTSYTFENITQDHTIEAIFEQITYTINSSSTPGGTISPSGTIILNYGESKILTITPDSGYKIKDVKVDGVSVGIVTSYTFENITQDHTIEAIFEKEITKITIILQIGNKNFTVNGDTKTLDSPPLIKNNRTLLPIRAVVESLGGNVSWDGVERKVTITLSTKTIELWIGKPIAKVNGVDTQIDPTNPKVVPEIIGGRTMLPLRFIAESLGCDVQWDGATKTITLIYISN